MQLQKHYDFILKYCIRKAVYTFLNAKLLNRKYQLTILCFKASLVLVFLNKLLQFNFMF